MYRVVQGEYELTLQTGGLPGLLDHYRLQAVLVDEFPSTGEVDEAIGFLGIGRDQGWPFLILLLRYSPSDESGFHPGILLIPETHHLFVGAGRRLVGYDLMPPARSWEDETDCGFWSWSRHGQVVLMAAELELAAWDLKGTKLWSRFVEPPWDYRVTNSTVEVDVMGTVSHLDLWTGQPISSDPSTRGVTL